jgi:hypothetical protein
MERIVEEIINRTVTNEQGEVEEVLDYTMRYIYNDEAAIIDGEEQVNSTLVKTEKIMSDGTIYLVTEGNGCINQIQIYPVPEAIVPPKTKEENLQEQIDFLTLQILGMMGV